jgi:hypothetical protein
MKFRDWLHNALITFKVTDGVIAGMAVASVIVAVLKYATTHSQLTQLKRAADQTDRALNYAQTQAEAAKSEAQTARDTFKLAFRPNLEIQVPVFTQSFQQT